MKRVLVTGGAGYIGASVVEKLLEVGHHPVVFDAFYWGQEVLDDVKDRITIIEGDIRNGRDLVYALQGTDAVIHLAGIVGQPACVKNPLAHYTTNVESTHTLVNCMTDHEVGHLVRDLIYCSSCSVYGNVNGMFEEVVETTPTMALSEYADGKLRAEKIIMKKAEEVPHFSPTILRLTTIFGWSPRPRLDLVTNLFAYQAVTERQVTIFGGGTQYRSLIHVRDVADALVTALDAPRYLRDRQLFHVGEEENNVTMRDLAQTVKKYVPDLTIKIDERSDTDRRDYRISCRKIKNMLGWRAKYTVEVGVQEMVSKFRESNIDFRNPKYRNNLFDYR
jgi:nucleoside-diphosphate-sugar epimerase